MQTSLRGIAKKAEKFKQHRFENLYRILNFHALKIAWYEINKQAAKGTDKISAQDFAKNLDSNLVNLVKRLKGKRYKTNLVRRVEIAKDNGKKRALGIPALADKLVQRAVAKILEAIYEREFLSCSHGYRPKKSPHTAIKQLSKELQVNKYSYIVEADIKGFFDNIDHQWMTKMLEQRIKDKAILNLINKWLKSGILKEDGKILNPITGTPQGGVVSPILANIYLHYVLDLWFEKVVKANCQGEAYLCRYADDFVCAFRYKADAERFYNALGKRLKKFNLELAEEKTRIISFSRFRKEEGTSFDFVGFEIRWGVSQKGKDSIRRRTSRNKLRKSLQNFNEWCKENRDNRLRNLFPKLNLKLRGYYNFYGIIGNLRSLYEFYDKAKSILYKWLNRRSQRRSFNWKEFHRVLDIYGIMKPKITESNIKQQEFEYI